MFIVDYLRVVMWFAANDIEIWTPALTGVAVGIIVIALALYYRRAPVSKATGLALGLSFCIGASTEGALMQFSGERAPFGQWVLRQRDTPFGTEYESIPTREEISLWATEDAVHIDRWNVRDATTSEVLATALAGSFPIDTVWEYSPGVPVYGASGGVQWRFGPSLAHRGQLAVTWTDWDREYYRDDLEWYGPNGAFPRLRWTDSDGWSYTYALRNLTVPEPSTIVLILLFLAAMMILLRR